MCPFLSALGEDECVWTSWHSCQRHLSKWETLAALPAKPFETMLDIGNYLHILNHLGPWQTWGVDTWPIVAGGILHSGGEESFCPAARARAGQLSDALGGELQRTTPRLHSRYSRYLVSLCTTLYHSFLSRWLVWKFVLWCYVQMCRCTKILYKKSFFWCFVPGCCDSASPATDLRCHAARERLQEKRAGALGETHRRFRRLPSLHIPSIPLQFWKILKGYSFETVLKHASEWNNHPNTSTYVTSTMNSSPVFICFLQVLCEAQGEASADPGRWSFWGRTKAHISGEFQKKSN